MTESKICTCPSGDGSLRWPCPKHPAVNQADVAAKLTFINGRPAMCGCQVEYSDGGGEYSDVIYVTLCAKHSGSAILDLVATNRIALTPEYEGQWHADLYLDREIPLAKVEGATPAEAVLALMSAERIDPEQESVEQAGGDERASLQELIRVRDWVKNRRGQPEKLKNTGQTYIMIEKCETLDMLEWAIERARAALAQPSPKCATCNDSGQIVVSGPHYQGEFQPPEYETEPCDMCAQPSPAQAEAERLREAYEWGYGDGQNNPNGYSDKKERDACVNELLKQPSTVQADAERPTYECTMGVGGGDGNLFVHGDHASIKAAQKIVLERDAALARVAELEKLSRAHDPLRIGLSAMLGSFKTATNPEQEGTLRMARQLLDATADARYGDFKNKAIVDRLIAGLRTPVAQAQHSVPGDIMRDAQRYRWLRDQQFYFSFSTENSDAGISSCTAGMSSRFKNLSWVDAAIDSAIAAAPGKEVGHE
ncbi:TPA: hypothetical protein SL796_002282 [Pseudomonas aeruginosa]|nr:hypothetical protein [Pseudomonas aeruginosa]HEJ5247964.1 hypothetical protein [Pseudomonas aeruginosa]HEJ5906087.1 hypothetical protein [Pseudomonas aeruginosa]